MEILRHPDVARDLKNLRRSAAPIESLEAWERLFTLKGLGETPAIDAFAGFGNWRVYKGRVVPLRENIGKSKGYRIIFQMINDEQCRVLVFSRHGIYKSEQKLISIVRERLKN